MSCMFVVIVFLGPMYQGSPGGTGEHEIRLSMHTGMLCSCFIYYRFIVRFPIGLDSLFITFTFLLYLLLSWTSSLSILSSAISALLMGYYSFIITLIYHRLFFFVIVIHLANFISLINLRYKYMIFLFLS